MVVLLFSYCLCVDTCLLDDITKYFCGGSFSEKLLRECFSWKLGGSLFFSFFFYPFLCQECRCLHAFAWPSHSY